MLGPRAVRRFGDHRSRPFVDLLGRVRRRRAGARRRPRLRPGQLTLACAARGRGARVVGVDSSPRDAGPRRAEQDPSGAGRVGAGRRAPRGSRRGRRSTSWSPTPRCSGCRATSTCCRGWVEALAPGRLVRLAGAGQLRRARRTRCCGELAAATPRAGELTPPLRGGRRWPSPAPTRAPGRRSAATSTCGRRRTCTCSTPTARRSPRCWSGQGHGAAAGARRPHRRGRARARSWRRTRGARPGLSAPRRPVFPFRRIFAVAQRHRSPA